MDAKRRRIFLFVLPVLSVGFFFGGLELLLRVVGFRPNLSYQGRQMPFWARNTESVLAALNRMSEVHGRFTADVEAYEEDPRLFYRLKPSLDIRVPFYDLSDMAKSGAFPDWSIRTDRQSRRVAGSSGGPSGDVRVALLGGSSVFGWGVDYEQTAAFCLEGMLRRAFPGKTIAVDNFGVPGYALSQQRMILDRLEDGYDLLLVDATSNCDMRAAVTDQEKERLRHRWPGRIRSFMERFRFFQLLETLLPGKESTGKQAASLPTLRVPLESYASMLDDVIGRVDRLKASLILMGLCASPPYVRRMAEVARERRVPYVVMAEIVEEMIRAPEQIPFAPGERERYQAVYGASILERDSSLYLVFPDKCHPNPTGHRVLAEKLLQIVLEHGWVK